MILPRTSRFYPALRFTYETATSTWPGNDDVGSMTSVTGVGSTREVTVGIASDHEEFRLEVIN